MNFKSFFGFLAAVLFSTALKAATITSINPTYGAAGDTIELLGSGFVFSPGTNVVKFGSTVSPNTFASTMSRLLAKVPASLAVGDVVKISVSVNGGPFIENNTDFKIISTGPYVASLNPVSGDAGTLVAISGVHFVGAGGTITVKFNGVTAPVTGDTTTADNILQYRAPAGVTTGPVTVTRTGVPTNSSTAIFYATPTVTNFSPSFGRAGTNVMIYGRNFLGATNVLFNGLSASWFTNNSPTQITATVPAGATTGLIRVQTIAAGTFPSTSNFVVRPLITGFTPTFGRVNTNVTIFGENLWGPTNVLFGGVKVTAALSGISYSQIIAKVPAGATNGFITVQTTNGSFTSSQRFYLPPVITTFAPTNGLEGTRVKIDGTNFLDASAVTFNGTPGQELVVTNNQVIGITVPADVITGPIFITTPFGTTNSAGFFYAAPMITGFTPNHGLPGTNVTFLGTNFAGVTAVKFNGTNAAFTLQTNGVLTAIVPTNAATGTISITGPAGTTVSAGLFTLDYTSDIAVTVSAPPAVLLGNNFTYTITITNQGPYAAPNVVLTNLLPGSVTLQTASISQGTLVTSGNPVTAALGTLASHAQATVTLTVKAQVATQISNLATVRSDYADPNMANNTNVFPNTVYIMPAIFSFSPNAGRAGTNVTILGENLSGATNVLFGGVKVTAPLSNIDYGQLTAVVPNGATNGFITVMTTNGSCTSTQLFYLPPVITGFTPTNSAPGTLAKIIGTNFLGATAVSFNGIPAQDFTVTNNGVVGAVVPEDVVTGPISITTPFGVVTSGTNLFYGTPVISSFNPTHGLPGTNVTILGTNFTGATAVRFNGTNAAFVVVTNGIITATVPTNATTGPISVTGPAGTAVSVGTFTLDPIVPIVPMLAVQRLSATQLQLSWLAALSDYFLQSNADVASSNSWSNVLTVPNVVGDKKVVAETIGDGAKFYRLKR